MLDLAHRIGSAANGWLRNKTFVSAADSAKRKIDTAQSTQAVVQAMCEFTAALPDSFPMSCQVISMNSGRDVFAYWLQADKALARQSLDDKVTDQLALTRDVFALAWARLTDLGYKLSSPQSPPAQRRNAGATGNTAARAFM